MLAQIPVIDSSTQVKPINLPGGFLWAINFKLPVPAAENGYIVQKIIQTDTGDPGSNITYWEVWDVKKGDVRPRLGQTVADFSAEKGKPAPNEPQYKIPVNDIFFKGYSPGDVGTYTIYGYAAFYHLDGLLKEDNFAQGTLYAGPLLATTQKPSFWTGKAYLYRKLKYNYVFNENKTDVLDESKGQINYDVSPIDMRPLTDYFGW